MSGPSEDTRLFFSVERWVTIVVVPWHVAIGAWGVHRCSSDSFRVLTGLGFEPLSAWLLSRHGHCPRVACMTTVIIRRYVLQFVVGHAAASNSVMQQWRPLLAGEVSHLEHGVLVKDIRTRREEVEVDVVGAMSNAWVEVRNRRVME